MGKKMLRLAVAGTAVAGAVVLPAQAALAADYSVGAGVGVDAGANYVTAQGTITDNTSGNDSVAVQTYIQRLLSVGSWVTVATGPRVTGVNAATSTVSPQPCVNGASYRAMVNWNWNNLARGTSYSGSKVC
ncbi:hypothetical protein E1293_45970 [Actinomadura darangshiensis]|uniref:Uncharacterized protein n=1 Tax=Actinomadura darangshiensis TaxID=705336 RepID=A0A4R4ZMR9_9ACTN|nr:hypothetical protein [Actinomadura darangshiensis]TDD60113.1 hypothetical protein E1293_45970 [Actinomadura darangshiensis]